MSMTDPVADFLTRIRNAQSAHKEWVDIPCSNLKKRIAFVLKEEKYIRDILLIKDDKHDILRLFLNYDMNNESVIKGIQRISKPGCRNYVTSDTLPRVLNGLGIAIITTSKGVMSNKKAKRLKIGGEVLCHVW
jgi:small subunit ribosomal protein S8